MSLVTKELESLTRFDTGLQETKERLIPGKTPRTVWMQHVARYYSAIPYIADKTVLDCACGMGYGTHVLSMNGAKMAVGVDLSEDAVFFARHNYERPGVQYLVMDAQNLTFQESTFDLVVSFETMEHLANPESFLEGVINCLKPNGTFIVSVPNSDALPEHVTRFSPFHVREFNLSELRDLINRFFGSSAFYSQPWHDREVAYRKRYLTILKRIKLGWLRPYVPGLAKKVFARIVIDPMASRDNAKLDQSAFEPRPISEVRPLGEDDSVLIAVCRDPKKLRDMGEDNYLTCFRLDGKIC